MACSKSPSLQEEPLTPAAFDQELEDHAAAAVRRDILRAAALFTDDAAVMFPGLPVVRGRDSIGALMSRTWPVINPVQVRYWTDEVHGAGDNVAVSITRYLFVLEPPNQPAVRDSGRYIFLWKRMASGRWQVHRALSHSAAFANR